MVDNTRIIWKARITWLRGKVIYLLSAYQNYEGEFMITVKEIKTAINSLPEPDYVCLRNWFSEKDWEEWDKRIEKDSEAGTLDFLIKEALNQKDMGTMRDL